MNINESKFLFVLFFSLIFSRAVLACPDNQYEYCEERCLFGKCITLGCVCLPKIGGDVGKVGEDAKQGVNNAAKEVEKGYKNLSKEGAIAVDNLVKTIEKGGKDFVYNHAKSAEDIKAEIGRAGKDTEQAVAAIGRYIERQANSTIEAHKKAIDRVREGKVIDAIWHLGLDPIRATSDNTAAAVTESSVLNTVAQVAATAYGGPQGAAAYAAWLTYQQTGDISLAVKVGVLAGASSYAMSQAGAMPTDSAYEVAKKTIVTGAIGGTAVAAAGGNEDAVKDAFLKAGAMVVVQDTFQRTTGHPLSGKASEGEPYCLTVSTTDCAPPGNAYIRNADGSLVLDERGVPKLDMSKLDPNRPAVGLKDPNAFFNEKNPVMKGVSKVPGMNGMAVFHDQWALKWEMGALTTPASIVPAVVLTYWGLGAPYYESLQKTGAGSMRRDMNLLYRVNGKVSEQSLDDHSKGIATAEPVDQFGNPIKPLNVRVEDVVQSYICNNANLVRMIGVERPSSKEHGFACRVLYSTEGGETAPWIAKNDPDYCQPRASEFVKNQEAMGFTCYQSAMNREK
jgi:hypothetical protein